MDSRRDKRDYFWLTFDTLLNQGDTAVEALRKAAESYARVFYPRASDSDIFDRFGNETALLDDD